MNGVLTVFRNRMLLLARGEDGVALAITLAFLLPIFVLTISIYALQETLVRKAELQNAVDAAAYSAAVVQSDYFSRFALVNKVLGWSYIQRERARADYALTRLCEEADDALKRDWQECRDFNRRSCCDKHKIENQDWGVGTLTESSMTGSGFSFDAVKDVEDIITGNKGVRKPLNQKTETHYSAGNNVANPKTLTISAVRSGRHVSTSLLANQIVSHGNTMEKCKSTFIQLEREFPVAVERAAQEILELNLKQTGIDWYSQVQVPLVTDLIERFTCNETDEARLFHAAGIEEAKCNARDVLGYGADRYFVLGTKLKSLLGPSRLGRHGQTGLKLPSLSVLAFILFLILRKLVLWLLWYIPWLPLRKIVRAAFMAAVIKLIYTESANQPVDDQFLHDINDGRRPDVAIRCSCKNDGPCRVLNFEGDKYLKMEWHYFTKRYASLGFGKAHHCVEPTCVLNQRIGDHKWGKSYASIYDRVYGTGDQRQTAIPGKPVYGKAIGATGRKLKRDFFGPKGSIQVIAARDNPNPLKLFGGQDSLKNILKKIPGGKVSALIKRFDAGGIYQIFNSHLSYNQLLGFSGGISTETFSGSQCPNFLYAVAASRIAVKPSSREEYCLYRPNSLRVAADGCCNLDIPDWEPFLVPYRSSEYTGWDTANSTLSPSGTDIFSRLKDALSFESRMRSGKDWSWYASTVSRNRISWQKKSLRSASVASFDILARLNDTRGPYPTDLHEKTDPEIDEYGPKVTIDTNKVNGVSFLLWGLAREYIER